MNIRRAMACDVDKLNELLYEVGDIHASKRPDVFKKDAKKYTDDELLSIIENDQTPIYVATDDAGVVVGYTFCIYNEVKDNVLLQDMKTLYIDDLCVKEGLRGGGIGRALFEHALKTAKENGCYNLTLNVWKLNEGALRFYEKCGMSPLKTVMEKIL